jgi:hypothetical protein
MRLLFLRLSVLLRGEWRFLYREEDGETGRKAGGVGGKVGGIERRFSGVGIWEQGQDRREARSLQPLSVGAHPNARGRRARTGVSRFGAGRHWQTKPLSLRENTYL